MVAVAARYLDEGNVFDPLMIIAGQNISWPHIMNVFIVSEIGRASCRERV